MPSAMHIAGVVIAGGQAGRLGGEKPLVAFAGGTLLDAVITRIAPQVETLAVNLRGDTAAQWRGDLPVIVEGEGTGPLAGVVAALQWAQEQARFNWLASVPGDTPFLPMDLVATLARAAEAGRPVVAHDGARMQNLCALWPLSCLDMLRRARMTAGSLFAAHDLLGSVTCPVCGPEHAFFNVNTPEDLDTARRIAAEEDG